MQPLMLVHCTSNALAHSQPLDVQTTAPATAGAAVTHFERWAAAGTASEPLTPL
jgi:hypothetical protein